jgi:hypothetical protein
MSMASREFKDKLKSKNLFAKYLVERPH